MVRCMSCLGSKRKSLLVYAEGFFISKGFRQEPQKQQSKV